MSLLQAALLGLVEGITEYLPVSSTFHLIWASHLLGISQTEFQKAFEVIIQSGAILAVLVLYLQTILNDRQLLKNVVISFIPTAVIGFALYKVIKGSFFEDFLLQIIIFAAVGILFLLFERLHNKDHLKRNGESLTAKEAILVGLAQALAVFPGVSRAGAVILALMFLKVKRDEAAKYSFLLALPTLLAASALDIVKSKEVLFENRDSLSLLAVGFVFSFISAFFVVRWFVLYLQRRDLSLFGWYRVIAALILLGIFIN